MTEQPLLVADNAYLHQLITAKRAAEARGDKDEVQRLEAEIERRIQMVGARTC